MEFEPLKLNHKELYNKYTAKKYRNSEASFTNMYIWRKPINAHICVVSDMLVLRFGTKGKHRYVMPFGDEKNMLDCIQKLYELCRQQNEIFEIIGADSNFVSKAETAGFDMCCEDMESARDYVYLSEKLASLSSKKLHSKKNHVNKFKRMYENYRYVPLDKPLYEKCYSKTVEWMNEKYSGDESKYKIELETIKDIFDNFEYLNLFGGAILVDDNVVAYTVGEALSTDTVLVHVEKADRSYDGSFAIVNNEFAKSVQDDFKYINREEDMGIEGLRKAKKSYRPEFLTEKIKCIFRY